MVIDSVELVHAPEELVACGEFLGSAASPGSLRVRSSLAGKDKQHIILQLLSETLIEQRVNKRVDSRIEHKQGVSNDVRSRAKHEDVVVTQNVNQ